MTDQLTPEKILQTGLAFWPSKTLLSAVEMGVFTELAQGPEPHDSLAGRLGLHPRASRDFLDTLVALGFLPAPAMSTRIRRRPTCFSTAESRHMSAASSKWPIAASIHSGQT